MRTNLTYSSFYLSSFCLLLKQAYQLRSPRLRLASLLSHHKGTACSPPHTPRRHKPEHEPGSAHAVALLSSLWLWKRGAVVFQQVNMSNFPSSSFLDELRHGSATQPRVESHWLHWILYSLSHFPGLHRIPQNTQDALIISV